MEVYVLLGFVLILSIYLGLELISKVPSTLHTPLMSGANAISGIALVGALVLSTNSQLQEILALLAITFASEAFSKILCVKPPCPNVQSRYTPLFLGCINEMISLTITGKCDIFLSIS